MTAPPLLRPRDALFLDFDGTLAEFGPDPEAIHLDRDAAASIDALAAALGGAVALISGRDLRDLARRTPEGVWRAGGHGAERIAPHEAAPEAGDAAPPDAALAPLRAVAAAHPGARIEMKGPVAALHYRAAPEAQRDAERAVRNGAAQAPGYSAQAGKMVAEIKPDSAHKGRALSAMCAAAPFAGRRPVMVGDDATDEDAILAAQALGGFGVKVGEGASAAAFRLADPAAVRRWLAEAARAFGPGGLASEP